jgi:hypothetical protein
MVVRPTHADKASAGCWSLLSSEWQQIAATPKSGVATGDDAVDFYRSCGWADEESLTLASTGMTTISLTQTNYQHSRRREKLWQGSGLRASGSTQGSLR